MDRDELYQMAESCIKAPTESVLIATEETANNFYSFWKDSEGHIWYTSARTDAFDAEIKEAAKQRKRKTSDATLREASEELVMQNMLTNNHKKSIA